jgi:type I restriction enzyme S subunit
VSFPRYPAYKESGLDWLPKVPSHWRIRKISWDLPYAIGWTPPSGKEEYYDGEHPWVTIADMEKGVIRDTASKISDLAIQERKAESVPAGSLLFSFKLSVGKVAILKTDAYTNEAIAAFKPNDKVDLHFWKYSGPEIIPKYGRENIYGAMLLNQELIRSVRFFAPPISEQRVIADFLDHETAKIDALIEEQQLLIELLEEKRQAIISHAVTKGLDPDAPVKDSGVEWMGDVPAHWSVCALRYLSTERCDGPFGSGLKSSHYTDDGARVIRLQNIRAGRFSDLGTAYVDLEYFRSALLKHSVAPGDVLIAGLGDERNMVGRACVAPDNLGPALVKADCFRFRLDARKADSSFVAYQLTAGATADGPLLASGSTRQRIPLLTMGARKIAVPPVVEQEQIVEFIQDQIDQIDQMDSKCRDAIELLVERRSALISAAVTGKIDVRNWQSESDASERLPMVAEAPATYEAREQ